MELYEFSLKDTTGSIFVKRYTSSAHAYQKGADTFSPIAIQRGEISFEFAQNEMTIIMPMETWPASEFKLVNPYGVIDAVIYSEAESIMFSGRVKACYFKVDNGTAKLTLSSIQEVLDSQVPVKVYSPSCPYELYGGDCGVNSETYKLESTYSGATITGNTIQHSDFALRADNYYTGGWVETKNERTTITQHVGDTLTVMYGLHEDTGGLPTFLVYPGCDKMIDTCSTKYNNMATFGGFPWVPINNPVMEEF